MVDLDLRKLSAPLEALRPKVDAAYQRLDAQWKAISDQLRKLPIPCTIWCIVSQDPRHPEDHVNLEWRKWKGSKRLCIVSYSAGNTQYGWEESEDVTPFEEWSAEQRAQMLQHVPALFNQAVKQVEEFTRFIPE